MRFTKKILAAALLASSIFMAGCGQVNIGYVDGERVMEEAPQIKAVLEEGEKKMQELQQEAEKTFEGKTGDELVQAQTDLQRKVQGVNQAYSTQLKHKLDTALAEISQAKNLDVVVESSENQSLVIQGGVDVTDEVIQKLQ